MSRLGPEATVPISLIAGHAAYRFADYNESCSLTYILSGIDAPLGAGAVLLGRCAISPET
jgi:hypothetical protein